MDTSFDFTAIKGSPKKNRRQLTLFINLDGVEASKKDLFVEFANSRAKCLKADHSAFNIKFDESKHLQAVDLHHENMLEFIDKPNCAHELKQKQIVDAKTRVINKFKANIKAVEGTYDYILVVGEMTRSSSRNSISNISQLNLLSNYLKEIITTRSSKILHLRVQVCFSNQIFLQDTTTTFASALVPSGKFVHLSAPTGWSMIGRNGAAIDYNLVHDVHFNPWKPFLNYVIMNNLDIKKIVEVFNSNELFLRKADWHPLMNLKKDRPEIKIEALNLKLHYPSGHSEDAVFSELENLNKSSFVSIDYQSRYYTPVLSRTPSQSSLFHSRSPSPRLIDASTPTPTII